MGATLDSLGIKAYNYSGQQRDAYLPRPGSYVPLDVHHLLAQVFIIHILVNHLLAQVKHQRLSFLDASVRNASL